MSKIHEGYIGPLFSGGGLRTWDMWLKQSAIHLCRQSVSRTMRLAAWQYLGFPNDPAGPPEGRVGEVRLLDRDIAGLAVKRKALSHNELVVQESSGVVRLFGIYDRSRTDEIRRKLRSAWPSKYREDGFERANEGEAV